jgi:Uma2 family endonuclease
MTAAYEEILDGAALRRAAPGVRHEAICDRLHEYIRASVANFPGTRLLPRRSQIRVLQRTAVCPDLSLVTSANGKLWLAAEIVSPDDHSADTVVKKQVYEEAKLPRLWMIDPRYDNVEIYMSSPYGLTLKTILAGREILTEKLLPEFQITVAELFQAGS